MCAKLVHNQTKCIGCNSCVNMAPQNWYMDETKGKAVLVGGKEKRGVFIADVFDCDVEINKKVAKACPMNIISVE